MWRVIYNEPLFVVGNMVCTHGLSGPKVIVGEIVGFQRSTILIDEPRYLNNCRYHTDEISRSPWECWHVEDY